MTHRSAITPLIVANWKMQLRLDGVVTRISALRKFLQVTEKKAHVVLCPSFPALADAHRTIGKSHIQLGAQDVFWDVQGAYTGEVSPVQLKEIGVTSVIIGHSERRHILGETEAMIAKKVLCARSHGLTPILCVGETAAERQRHHAEQVVARQLVSALQHVPPPVKGKWLVIAYEPVWAIGTGRPADPVEAMHMFDHIKQTLLDVYPHQVVARQVRVLYGGSVDRHNITDYVGPELYHGALIGGASLEVPGFVGMIKSVIQQFHG